MDFGSLGSYFEVVLAKRLGGTDIDRMVSHGHELGGFGQLRRYLGDDDRKIRATYLYVGDGAQETAYTWTTWYDARRRNPNRGPEYRLYYPECEPVTMAGVGDLAVVAVTSGGELAFVFAEGGSDREADVMYLFGVDDEYDMYMPSRDMGRRVDAFGAEILSMLGVEAEVPWELGERVDEMVGMWPDGLPHGRVFADFARYASGIDPLDDPDAALVDFYNTQTALFMEYERYEMDSRLGPLVRDVSDPDYDAILSVAMSLFQRRRSSAGHALEYHLEAVFDAFGIDYTAQGRTEGKERPDFLFPSEGAYHDPLFPAARLTLLGAKTTAKDRWRQVLQEGDRVRVKHLVTLEPAISVDQTSEMAARNLQLVVPEPIHATYQPSQRCGLWTVRDFCDCVLGRQRTIA